MKEFTVPMALADFVPVFLFLAAAIILQRMMYSRMSKGAFALFAGGTINVFMAGLLKALYKLLYAAGVCDFKALSDIFMPLQSIGFMLAGIAAVSAVFRKKGVSAAAAVPVSFSGTPVFITLMVLGLAGMNVSLSVMAARLKKYSATVLYIIALIGCMCMGYLSSRDFTEAAMNWLAEGINILSQGALLAATIILNRAAKAEKSE